MVLNKDFREFIESLNTNNVQYLIVGGYAVGLHGYPRYTKDLDVWLLASADNADRIMKALSAFGLADLGLIKEDFLKTDEFIQIGYPPNRIDLVLSCDGVDFTTCYQSRLIVEVDGLKINFIDLENLKKNKKATGRLQDLADLENLKP
ncbi:MAG: hypothetical protein D4R67_01850 [Bacteroidetes bacterium]|nr:MAG: hypothetical protein D4R67_01850 [Bacteroidota bacterium]